MEFSYPAVRRRRKDIAGFLLSPCHYKIYIEDFPQFRYTSGVKLFQLDPGIQRLVSDQYGTSSTESRQVLVLINHRHNGDASVRPQETCLSSLWANNLIQEDVPVFGNYYRQSPAVLAPQRSEGGFRCGETPTLVLFERTADHR